MRKLVIFYNLLNKDAVVYFIFEFLSLEQLYSLLASYESFNISHPLAARGWLVGVAKIQSQIVRVCFVPHV